MDPQLPGFLSGDVLSGTYAPLSGVGESLGGSTGSGSASVGWPAVGAGLKAHLGEAQLSNPGVSGAASLLPKNTMSVYEFAPLGGGSGGGVVQCPHCGQMVSQAHLSVHMAQCGAGAPGAARSADVVGTLPLYGLAATGRGQKRPLGVMEDVQPQNPEAVHASGVGVGVGAGAKRRQTLEGPVSLPMAAGGTGYPPVMDSMAAMMAGQALPMVTTSAKPKTSKAAKKKTTKKGTKKKSSAKKSTKKKATKKKTVKKKTTKKKTTKKKASAKKTDVKKKGTTKKRTGRARKPYDSRVMCGVWNEERQHECRRALSCKLHSNSAKRKVQRPAPFDQLLDAQQKEKEIIKRKKQKEKELAAAAGIPLTKKGSKLVPGTGIKSPRPTAALRSPSTAKTTVLPKAVAPTPSPTMSQMQHRMGAPSMSSGLSRLHTQMQNDQLFTARSPSYMSMASSPHGMATSSPLLTTPTPYGHTHPSAYNGNIDTNAFLEPDADPEAVAAATGTPTGAAAGAPGGDTPALPMNQRLAALRIPAGANSGSGASSPYSGSPTPMVASSYAGFFGQGASTPGGTAIPSSPSATTTLQAAVYGGQADSLGLIAQPQTQTQAWGASFQAPSNAGFPMSMTPGATPGTGAPAAAAATHTTPTQAHSLHVAQVQVQAQAQAQAHAHVRAQQASGAPTDAQTTQARATASLSGRATGARATEILKQLYRQLSVQQQNQIQQMSPENQRRTLQLLYIKQQVEAVNHKLGQLKDFRSRIRQYQDAGNTLNDVQSQQDDMLKANIKALQQHLGSLEAQEHAVLNEIQTAKATATGTASSAGAPSAGAPTHAPVQPPHTAPARTVATAQQQRTVSAQQEAALTKVTREKLQTLLRQKQEEELRRARDLGATDAQISALRLRYQQQEPDHLRLLEEQVRARLRAQQP